MGGDRANWSGEACTARCCACLAAPAGVVARLSGQVAAEGGGQRQRAGTKRPDAGPAGRFQRLVQAPDKRETAQEVGRELQLPPSGEVCGKARRQDSVISCARASWRFMVRCHRVQLICTRSGLFTTVLSQEVSWKDPTLFI